MSLSTLATSRNSVSSSTLRSLSDTCSSPSAKILWQMAVASSVPNDSTRSSRLASTPLDTLLNTVVDCSTSSRSRSLREQRAATCVGARSALTFSDQRRRALPHSHAVAPVDHLVLVARNLEPLAMLFVPHHRNVGEPLLACVGVGGSVGGRAVVERASGRASASGGGGTCIALPMPPPPTHGLEEAHRGVCPALPAAPGAHTAASECGGRAELCCSAAHL